MKLIFIRIFDEIISNINLAIIVWGKYYIRAIIRNW